MLATGQDEPRKFPSGPTLTATAMVAGVKDLAGDWKYQAVSIGYPGPVPRPIAEPHNLAPGWIGFDYQEAFGWPVKVTNEAAMQALGSYKGGKMLFLKVERRRREFDYGGWLPIAHRAPGMEGTRVSP